jgi:FtsZ-binding cell division protein ZapB
MAAADLSSKQLELLKDRNAKLSAQGAVHRQEIARLQRHVDELLEREGQWKETVLCLNRVWDELHDNIGFLKFR